MVEESGVRFTVIFGEIRLFGGIPDILTLRNNFGERGCFNRLDTIKLTKICGTHHGRT